MIEIAHTLLKIALFFCFGKTNRELCYNYVIITMKM